MSKLRLPRRECAVAGTPWSTLDRQKRKSRLPHQSTGHRRRAMDELGAALRRVSKFLSREWIDASTASIARFENGHLFAGGCKLPSGYEARGARAENHEVGQRHRLASRRVEDEVADGMCWLA